MTQLHSQMQAENAEMQAGDISEVAVQLSYPSAMQADKAEVQEGSTHQGWRGKDQHTLFPITCIRIVSMGAMVVLESAPASHPIQMS